MVAQPSSGGWAKISGRLKMVKYMIGKRAVMFYTQDRIISSDSIALVQTIYTAAFLAVIVCSVLSYQIFTDRGDVKCALTSNSTRKIDNIDNYCKQMGTFLVEKALDPAMRSKNTYPGVSDYKHGVDDIIVQRSNDFLVVGLGFCAVLALIVNLRWKMMAVHILDSVLNHNSHDNPREARNTAEFRAFQFMDRVGYNGSFGLRYIFYRLASLLIPALIMGFLTLNFGQRYITYGISLIVHRFDGSGSWPSPSTIIFPHVAKCDIVDNYWIDSTNHDFIFRIESAQCQLPLNAIFRHLFFFVWWFLVIALVYGFFKFLLMFRYFSETYRNYVCREYLAVICLEEVVEAMKYRSFTGEDKSHKLVEVTQVKMDYGDMILLSLLKKNLSEYQFRNFIWYLANPADRTRFDRGMRIRTAQEMAVRRGRAETYGIPLGKIGKALNKSGPTPHSIVVQNNGVQVMNVLAENPEIPGQIPRISLSPHVVENWEQ